MKKRIKEILSENLIKIRSNKRCSQKQIAAILAIKQPSYNRIEIGETNITADKLYELAKFYGVSIDDFFLENANFLDGYINKEERCKQLEEELRVCRMEQNKLIQSTNMMEEELKKKNHTINILLANLGSGKELI